MSEPVRKPEREEARKATQPPGIPRWVKASGVVILVVAAVLVLIMLLAGGEHGPGLHTGVDDPTMTSLVFGGADGL